MINTGGDMSYKWNGDPVYLEPTADKGSSGINCGMMCELPGINGKFQDKVLLAMHFAKQKDGRFLLDVVDVSRWYPH